MSIIFVLFTRPNHLPELPKVVLSEQITNVRPSPESTALEFVMEKEKLVLKEAEVLVVDSYNWIGSTYNALPTLVAGTEVSLVRPKLELFMKQSPSRVRFLVVEKLSKMKEEAMEVSSALVDTRVTVNCAKMNKNHREYAMVWVVELMLG